MREPIDIIETFIASGYRPQARIPGNRVFLTDNTASTLVWVEGRVVIELYLLFPNTVTEPHAHPFINQMVFISGDPVGLKVEDGRVRHKVFTDADIGVMGRFMPIGDRHGFNTGPLGAVFYNIQIWPENVTDPRSAAIEFLGPSMGPLHDALRAQ